MDGINAWWLLVPAASAVLCVVIGVRRGVRPGWLPVLLACGAVAPLIGLGLAFAPAAQERYDAR